MMISNFHSFNIDTVKNMISLSLSEDLQTPKENLNQFINITKRILDYLPNIISNKSEIRGYTILTSTSAGTTKNARPINNNLFIYHADDFDEKYQLFITTLNKIKNKDKIKKDDYFIIDSIVYTIQQSIGIGMDFLCNPNSARKHVGNRFEELIRCVVSEAGISNKKIVFKIPYPSDKGIKSYSCETDLILSPYKKVKSDVKTVNEKEIIISLKTTSKDRMGKIFLDKLLIEKFAEHPVKVIGIFLNDIQRKGQQNVNYTLVSGLFMVYTKFLIQLEGVYFVDPPPITKTPPYNEYISTFSKFLVDDIWEMLSS